VRSFFVVLVFLVLIPLGISSPSQLRMDTSTVDVKKPDPQKEKSVFSDSKFNYEKDQSYSGVKESFLAWLLRKIFGAATDETFNTFWAVVRILLIVAAVVLILYLLFKTEIRRIFTGKSAETPVNFADVPENINELDIETMIREAVSNNNYRLATRWWYLKILKLLSNKEFISWKPHKTNFEYYHELKQLALRNSFRDISRVYEHVWYGDFSIDKAIYETSVEQFRSFERELNSNSV
jgi:hypothetical protein